jgi:hypothetical protein
VIAGIGGVLLLVFMFTLPWYGPGQAVGTTASLNGWHGLTNLRWLLLLLDALTALALVVVQATRRAPALPASMSVIVTLLGAATVLCLGYRVLIDPPADQRAGAYLGLVAACAIAVGGYHSMRQEGISPKDGPSEIPTVDPSSSAGS